MSSCAPVTLIVLWSTMVGSVCAFPHDGLNACRDELVAYYYSLNYTSADICGFLLCVHNIAITLRQLKRIKQRLKLKRAYFLSPMRTVLQKIQELHSQGFSNYGYRFMWKLLTSVYSMNVTQDTVRLTLRALDPGGVYLRSQRRLRNRLYHNKGPNFLLHVDGYDKLKPYGIAIHGAIDGFSRKLLWLKAAHSNNDPLLIANNYLHFVKTTWRVPRCIRADGGTENVIIKDLQVALRSTHNDPFSGSRSFITGRSPANQRIERFWGSLKPVFTVFWKNYFEDMVDAGILRVGDPIHLECLRFCFLPIIQEQLDDFSATWNSHRIRRQNQSNVICDKPDVLYYQPEMFGTHDYSRELACSPAAVDLLVDQYSEEYYEFGCRDEFLQLIEILFPLTRFDFLLKRSVEEAQSLFVNIISKLEEVNV